MMQVQYETTLIDSLPLRSRDFVSTNLQTRSLDTYALNQNPLKSIDHVASSPIHNLIAIHISGSNHIAIYDTRTRTRRDRFPLKACDKRYSKQSFSVSGIDFSPDGLRLAVGQTDCIIYIYKLPNYTTQSNPSCNNPANTSCSSHLSDPATLNPPTVSSAQSNLTKPIITGKFASSSPVTCLKWTEWGIIFGCQDGKTKIILLPSPSGKQQQSSENIPAKVSTVYIAPKDVVPISLACKASMLAIGYLNSSVQLICLNLESAMQDHQSFNLLNSSETSGSRRSSTIAQLANQYQNILFQSENQDFLLSATIEHSCPANCIALLQTGTTLCLAGSDGRLSLNSIRIDMSPRSSKVENKIADQWNSPQQQTLNTRPPSLVVSKLKNIELKEDIIAIDYSSINEILAIVTRNKLLFMKLDQATNNWQVEKSFIGCKNMFAFASISWSRDGTHLIAGTSNGSVELFRCSWIKHSINDQLDICLIAKNRVRITDKARNLLATYKTQYEIKRVNLLENGQSVIIWTSNSLLLSRMDLQLQSEIPWSHGVGDKVARFSFTDSIGYVIVCCHRQQPQQQRSGSIEMLIVKLGCDSIIYSNKSVDSNRSTVSLRRFPPINFFTTENTAASSSTPHSRSSPSRRVSETNTSDNQLVQQVDESTDETTEWPMIKFIDASSNRQEQMQTTIELLAYVVARRQVNMVNLSTSREFKFDNHDEDIVKLTLSHTGQYLFMLDALGRLYLLENVVDIINNDSSDNNAVTHIGKHSTLMVDHDCKYANWIQETDVLVAQCEHNVLIWYDLQDSKASRKSNTVDKIDTKLLNINNVAPLIDLSLVEVSEQAGSKANRLTYPIVIESDGSNLQLSNGRKVPLDSLRIDFYREVGDNRLDNALELLEKDPSSQERGININRLFQKLGWLALERENVQIAMASFERANMSKICDYLSKCLNEMTPEQSAIKIATLCGQWSKFERLNENNQEIIVAVYRRLNKWSRLIDYLTRMQQIRQRDLAEKDFQDWLISKGRHVEAAEVYIKSSGGNLVDASGLLMKHGKYSEACDLILKEHKRPVRIGQTRQAIGADNKLLDLITELDTKLIQTGQLSRAAQLNDMSLNNRAKALTLYVQANDFERALRLTKKNPTEFNAEQVKEIERSYAKHLLDQKSNGSTNKSHKLTLKAVNHLIAAGEFEEALKLAVELEEFEVAYDIIKQLSLSGYAYSGADVELFTNQCKQVAEHMHQIGLMAEALNAYKLAGGCAMEIVAIELEQGNYEEAYRLSLQELYDGNRTKANEEFVRYANSLVESCQKSEMGNNNANRDSSLKRAESIYLLIDRLDLAIGAYEKAEKFDRMLELIEEHQSDQLESTLLHLARRMEASGRYEEAERYLLRASDSEWTNVVRMYRLANKWPEAYRVARDHCASDCDPLLVQLAYWWAKSIVVGNVTDDESATKVSSSNNNSNSSNNAGGVDASSSFINEAAPSNSYSLIEKAKQMLQRLNVLVHVVQFSCENKNFQLAIDLGKGIEDLERDCVRRYATYLEQQHKFDRAEQVLLEHNLVELAARMYLDNGRHMDAVRVVERQMHPSGTSIIDAANNNNGLGDINDSNNNNNNNNNNNIDDTDIKLLNEILIECANRIADEALPADKTQSSSRLALRSEKSNVAIMDELTMALRIFLRAQRPDLGVEMYVRRGLWQDAIQVAQRFAPKLVESVEHALDEQVGDDMDSIVATAANIGNLDGRRPGQQSASVDENRQTNVPGSPVEKAIEPIATGAVSRRGSLAAPSTTGVKDLLASLEVQRKQIEMHAKEANRRAARQVLASFVETLTSDLVVGQEPSAPLSTISEGQLDERLIVLEKSLKICDPQNNNNRLLGWLFLQRGSGTKQLDNNVCWKRIVLICDYVMCHCQWGTNITSGDPSKWSVWVRLRSVLELCIEALGASMATSKGEARLMADNQSRAFGLIESLRNGYNSDANMFLVAQMERRLLAAHYIVLLNTLTWTLLTTGGSNAFTNSQRASKQQRTAAASRTTVITLAQMEQLIGLIVDNLRSQVKYFNSSPEDLGLAVALAFKISFSLIRYTDLIEARATLFNVSLWSIAVKRDDISQVTLKRALELHDYLTTNSSNSMNIDQEQQQQTIAHKELSQLVDLPEPKNLKLNLGLISTDKLPIVSEARQWLLESTIGLRSKWKSSVESHPVAVNAVSASLVIRKSTNLLQIDKKKQQKQACPGVCLISGLVIDEQTGDVRFLGESCTGAQCCVYESECQLLSSLGRTQHRQGTIAQDEQTKMMSQQRQERLRQRQATAAEQVPADLSDVAQFLQRTIGRHC